MTAIELKHQANLQRWAQAIQECRNNGKSAKAWCEMEGWMLSNNYCWIQVFM